MSKYLHVEKPSLDQLGALGWRIVNQGQGMIPSDPAKSLRSSFREGILAQVFRDAIVSTNVTADGNPWLSDRRRHPVW